MRRVIGPALVTAVLWLAPSGAWAPTAVEYAVGPGGLAGGQLVRLAFFNPTDAPVGLTLVLLASSGKPLKQESFTCIPFSTVALTLAAEADLDLPAGDRAEVLAVVLFESGLRGTPRTLPAASLQIMDGTSFQTTLVLPLSRRGVREAAHR